MRYKCVIALSGAVSWLLAPAMGASHGLPLAFVPNRGQADRSIRFMVQTPEFRAGFWTDGAVFQLHGQQVDVRFPGGHAEPAGLTALPGYVNFLLGRGQYPHLPVYESIEYRGLYPGIDLRYVACGSALKSEFRVAPGASPSLIRMQYPGALVSVNGHGDLLVQQGDIELKDAAPAIYQPGPDGSPVPVQGGYEVIDADTAAFRLGEYDPSRPLVIDPAISYSTYLGGSGMGAVTGVAVDSSGSLYVTGWTEALDFPIAGAIYAANRGGVDAFAAKLNSTGSALLYATYIGGNGDDRAAGIAVDTSGQVYVTGSTTSSNFPLQAAYDSTVSNRDAFVLKLNPAGTALVYSTYLGGTNWDAGTAIAIDASGNAYVAGDTFSANFPTWSAAQFTLAGNADAFAAKFSAAGTLVYSTLLGGSNADHAGGIAVDSSGNAYVAGGTMSANFPLVAAIQGATGGGQDAFVTKIAPGGNQFLYSTYLGGSGGGPGVPEQANAAAVDSTGSVYLAGVTASSNFPVTQGAFQTTYNGGQDAFIAKINAAGSVLTYSTFLGGSSFDWASGIRVDATGNAYVAGYTSSFGFPVVGGVQPGFNGLYDAFVSKLSTTGNAILFSTYFGGTGSDAANAIAIDASGNMFVGGQTASVDFPLAGAIQSNNAGGSIGWAARIGVTAPPPQTPAIGPLAPSSGNGNSVTFTAQYTHPSGATALTTAALLVNTSATTGFACYVSYNRAANQFTIWNDPASSGTTVIPGGGSAQNSQCTLNGPGSGASISGTTLTLSVSLTFRPGFAGVKSVYLYAADSVANTGWVARGTWTVTIPPPQPSVDSVSPNTSSGSGQTFTFVFSDTQDPANLTGMAMLFNSSVTLTNACYLVYDRVAGTVALIWDGGGGSDSKPVSSPTVLQNSQCTVGAVSSAISGLSNIVTVAITFKAAFGGLRNIYGYAAAGAINTGWVQAGTFNVTTGGFPIAQSVVPPAGSGPAQRFSFTVSDAGGANFITGVAMLFAATFNQVNACNLVYDRAANTVALSYDNPANGTSPVVPGSSAVVSNSQCTLRAANSTVVIGTTSVVVTVDLQFNATFSGAKTVFLYGAEAAANTGFVTVGSWTVTGGAPTADSMSPASGSGSAPTFAFTVSDSATPANITGMSMIFTVGSPSNIANACYLVYNRTAATIGLYDNAGTSLSTKPIGSSAALQNSQCAAGFTVMTTSGNSVTFNVNLVFKPAFSGTKSAYLLAQEPASDSGWVLRGTWTVP